ncbi:cytosolic protein [Sphingobacteriales bacterium UPWRP_1]|nr:cytosolic protein [Sphingobacteriales bacterium TSM_CSM]PSJ74594.1 cytosolic protein [Sphingobacteriales bacterium UPWRP_1]
MTKIDLQDVYEYVEKNITHFHQQRLDYVSNKIDLDKILEQKNPYLFRAKHVQTAQDLIKGFIDAFLQSQEETLFGHFIEGLAIFVADKVFGAKKSTLIGMDLEFEKDNTVYAIEIKAGWNWGNSSQLKQLKINAKSAKEILEKETGKKVVIVNGCCFGKKRNMKPIKDGYYKICGQEFWELISNQEDFYIQIIKPIGHKAKEKNDEFYEVYSALINKLTVDFTNRFCDDGRINWQKIVAFNSKKIDAI